LDKGPTVVSNLADGIDNRPAKMLSNAVTDDVPLRRFTLVWRTTVL
jgi:hypothetical protein